MDPQFSMTDTGRGCGGLMGPHCPQIKYSADAFHGGSCSPGTSSVSRIITPSWEVRGNRNGKNNIVLFRGVDSVSRRIVESKATS